jgi:diguanylate cyclase (GGDEF)-like protein
VLAAVLSTTISATIGVTSLALGGAARWTEFGAIWLTWWLGDMGGALVVAPVLVLWATDARIRWTGSRAIEALALLAGLVVVSQLVFGAPIATVRHDLPVEFACVPFVMWAAYRFGRREVATAVVLLAGLAVWGTLRQAGPFARDSANESLLLVQSFLMIVSLTGLMLASLVAETRSAQNQLRQLVFTDPLTGLGNYRNLVSALELEIERFHRTGRRFSFVLFDLDRLKRINDRYGHAVGSRALCRLADAISDCCRGIDHAARLGGDEFALVLPDTTAEDAWAVAARVAARLAGDGEVPAVSATAGIAVYPDDGETTELLFETADRVLYKGKRGRYARATVGFRDLPQ